MKKLQFSHKEQEPFYREIRQGVDAYMEAEGLARYANGYIWFKAACYLAVAIAAYSALLFLHASPLALLALGVAYGTSCLMLAINIGHDAAHQCVSRRRGINNLICAASFSLLGVSGYLWQLRHNRSHHVFPNVDGCDIDIDENPFLRLSPHHPRRWYQRYQHWYAPFIYWLVSLHTIFYQDFVYLLKRNLANMRDISHPPLQYALFFVLKVFYVTVALVIPLWALPLPWWRVISGYLIVNFVISSLFILLLIGTHFTEENHFPLVQANGTIAGSWASHAIATSLDWSPSSRVANIVVGGANTHAAHHLFPGVTHAHYPRITAIIAEVTKKHGIPYKRIPLSRMVVSHFKFLKQMAAPNNCQNSARYVL